MDIINRLVTTQPGGFDDDYAPEEEESPDYYFSLAELADRRASLVLGEPGVGKSTAMRHLRDSWTEAGEAIELIDLRECTSDRNVEIAFESLSARGSRPILLLDSVDEAPTLIRNFVAYLRKVLTHLIEEGWRVIATCRTAESVVALDSLFEELEEGAAHVLLPLRRSDVAAFATSMGIDSEEFQVELSTRRLDSLAAIPYTLRLLCDIYVADASFPESRADLFDRTIALSLGHTSVGSYTAVTAMRANPSSRVATAERLAAFATFAGTTDYALFEAGALSPATQTERLVGQSPVEGRAVALEYGDFQEVLRTPLFASSGTNQRRFAHRRLQDFLAARFLIRHQISRAQLASILLVPDGDVIPPQMADVTTWLVALDGEAFRWLVEVDPISLVRNKIALDLPELAEDLVDLLLQRSGTAERAITWRDELSGLGHRGLASQLTPILRAGTESEKVVALRILSDSYVPGLEAELASLVADRAANPALRERSAGVLLRQELSDYLDTADLIAPDFFIDDGNAELRGLILRTLWPDAITPELLTALLVSPPEHFVGSYSMFLASLTQSLPLEYAANILLWAASSDALDRRAWNGRGSLRALVDSALSTRIGALAEGEPIPVDVATALYAQITAADRRIPVARNTMSDGVRYRLIRALASKLSADRIGWFRLQGVRDPDGIPLIDREDVPWMLGVAQEAPASERPLWAELIDRFLNSERADDMELIWAVRDTPLWEFVRYRFDAIPLESDLARRARDLFEVNEEITEADAVEAQAMSADDYRNGVRDRISESRADSTRFWDLARWLDVDLETRRFSYAFVPDLLSTDASRQLEVDARNEVRALAIKFLTEPRARKLMKHTPKRISLGPIAAYQALHTLSVHDPSALTQLSTEDWEYLNPAILEFPLVDDGTGVREELLQRSFSANPVALSQAIHEHLRRVSLGTSVSNYLAGIADFTDPAMARTLQTGIRNQAETRGELARIYLATDRDGALAWMLRRMKVSSTDAELAAILNAALRDSVDDGVLLLQVLIANRPELAATVLPLFAQLERFEPVPLSAVDVATRVRIYEAVARLFPPGESFPAGVHSVSPKEDLAEWRDNVLLGVVREGTRESYAAVVGVAERMPDPVTAHAVVRARELYRIAGWVPLGVSEFLSVLEEKDRRLIRSARDVKVAVTDALREMAGWLRGETPQAFALWDFGPEFRSPKDENRISDWYSHGLRLLLARSGLIINREVEVVNLTGRGVGRRNDIRVEVRDAETGRHHVVVVEVKGIWNRDVRTSLRSQLAGEYLTELGLTHGIYLVVTFPWQQISVPAKATATRLQSRRLQEHLDAEAASLAPALDISAVIHDARMPV